MGYTEIVGKATLRHPHCWRPSRRGLRSAPRDEGINAPMDQSLCLQIPVQAQGRRVVVKAGVRGGAVKKNLPMDWGTFRANVRGSRYATFLAMFRRRCLSSWLCHKS